MSSFFIPIFSCAECGTAWWWQETLLKLMEILIFWYAILWFPWLLISFLIFFDSFLDLPLWTLPVCHICNADLLGNAEIKFQQTNGSVSPFLLFFLIFHKYFDISRLGRICLFGWGSYLGFSFDAFLDIETCYRIEIYRKRLNTNKCDGF